MFSNIFPAYLKYTQNIFHSQDGKLFKQNVKLFQRLAIVCGHLNLFETITTKKFGDGAATVRQAYLGNHHLPMLISS